MLTAINESGETISLVGNVRDEIAVLRKFHQFFCPICKEPLIIKSGSIRIPHFAHRKNAHCIASIEPESAWHIQGKRDLYDFFVSNGLFPRLEHYFPDIRQRPDIFVEKGSEKFAIEFQCTPIPANLVKSRTNGYQALDITPIWIFGGFPYIKRYNNHMYQLSDFLWSLTKQNGQGTKLLSYHPESCLFYVLSNIAPLSPRKVFARLTYKHLQKISIPYQTAFPIQPFYLPQWISEKNKWLERKVRFGSIVHDSFLKNVYSSQNNPFLLPYICGLPVSFMESFHSHSLEWQFYIWNDCLRKLQPGKRVSLKYIYYKMNDRIGKRHIKLRLLPLHQENNWRRAVYHYFELLVQLKILIKVDADLFEVYKNIRTSNDMEEARRKEKFLEEKLNKNLILGDQSKRSLCFLFD